MKEESISTKLQELFDLYKSGALDKQEYELLKAELLNKSENLLPKQSETKNKPEIDEGNTDKEKPKIQDEGNLSLLQQKLKEAPSNIDLLHKYAQSLYKEGNYKEVIKITFKLLSLNTNDAEAEKLLLNSYINLNRHKDAISALERWISKNPNEPRHNEKLVEVKSLYDIYKRKRNRNKIIAIATVVVIIVLIVLSIFVENNSEKKLALEKERTAYELVKRKQLVSPCMDYLHKYPNGVYVAEVKALQEDFQWKEAKTSNTVNSYEKYLSFYPDGRYIEDAKEGITIIEDKISLRQELKSRYPSYMDMSSSYKEMFEKAVVTEKNNISKIKNVVDRNNKTLFFRLDNGKNRAITDVYHSDGTIEQLNFFHDVLNELNAYVIHSLYTDGDDYKLIDKTSGKFTRLYGKPIISNNKTRFAAIETGMGIIQFQICKINADKSFTPEYVSSFDSWNSKDIKWISEDEFETTQSWYNLDEAKERTIKFKYDEAWRLVNSEI